MDKIGEKRANFAWGIPMYRIHTSVGRTVKPFLLNRHFYLELIFNIHIRIAAYRVDHLMNFSACKIIVISVTITNGIPHHILCKILRRLMHSGPRVGAAEASGISIVLGK